MTVSAEYRAVIATAAAPTVYLGELPFSALSYSSVLNGSASASVTLPLDSVANTTMEILPGSTVLWVERSGTLVFGGIIWTMSGDAASNPLTLNAGDFMSYYARRIIRSTLSFSSVDTHLVARGIIDYANGVTDALSIVGTADTSLSGVTVSRTFSSWDRKNVGGAVAQLSAINNGFDFKLELTYAAGNVPTVEFVCTSPNNGRATDLVFDLQSNVESVSFNVDGSQIVTQVDALGVGQGPDQLVATSTQASSQYALTQSAVSFSGVDSLPVLQAHADRQLVLGRSSVSSVTANVRADVEPLPSDYFVGDIVSVRASKGFFTSPSSMRIVEINVSTAGNQETVLLKLADASAFATI